jgi:AcrR family transcriptional regulator
MTRPETAIRILEAARACLLADGFAALSTRRVADEAGVPLSQIHYHFRGKRGLVLALLDHENLRLVRRQRGMYGTEVPLWRRYDQACDLLEEDLRSGYVRVLQEMIAAGWSDRVVARQVISLLTAWFEVLADVAREAERRLGPLDPFTADDVAGLVGLAFLGGEALILLGDDDWSRRTRRWLRRIGELIRQREEADATVVRRRRTGSPRSTASRPTPARRPAR